MNKYFRRLATVCMVMVIGVTLLACVDRNKNKKDGGGDQQAKADDAKTNKDDAKKTAKKSGDAAKIGEEVSFKDSTWVVIGAEDKGGLLKSNNQFQEDARTGGKYIMVQFKVTNLGKKEQRIINTPKLIDSEGREYKDLDNQTFYIPQGAKTMALEAIPAGLPREFHAVYEIPGDAKGLRFQARDLSSVFSPDYKLIDLGF
jgi:hypothetical protein